MWAPPCQIPDSSGCFGIIVLDISTFFLHNLCLYYCHERVVSAFFARARQRLANKCAGNAETGVQGVITPRQNL